MGGMRRFVTGPEDPKLVPMPAGSPGGRLALAFSSLPPTTTRPGCDQTTSAVYQMYLAQHGEALANLNLNNANLPASLQ